MPVGTGTALKGDMMTTSGQAPAPRPAAFLLFRTRRNALELAASLEQEAAVIWAAAAYGPCGR